ncbi:STN domain-containing protein [Pedomonas mirosovicensis]|uniref:STN domain-containing protein n=1 Tax=Pedomonas mirosovicensis TaxID=2908641 RepID=UPI00216A3DAC|nr:STN domain-containing protein [Pedomonas mirosovicensis]MCH8686434.1 STN domain-containing protein [Pedomonas mirosovicensis]
MTILQSRCRAIGLALTLGLGGPALVTAAPTRDAGAALYDFAIPPQPLGDALSLFARQTGLAVLHPPIPPGELSPGVRGRRTAREALDRLLAGTTLEIAATPRQPAGGFALRSVRRASPQGSGR